MAVIIAKREDNGSYEGVVCPSGTMSLRNIKNILLKYYTNPAKVNRLLALGDLVSVGKDVRKHGWTDSDELFSGKNTVAWHRDIGKSWKDSKLKKFGSWNEMVDYAKKERVIPYIYAYILGEWHVYRAEKIVSKKRKK